MPDGGAISETMSSLHRWAKEVDHLRFSSAYLFGSLRNHHGARFIPGTSDVDLLVPFSPTSEGLLQRWHSLQYLRRRKQMLEQQLVQILSQRSHGQSVINIICPTELEIFLDDGFYSSNRFQKLSSDSNTPIFLERGRPMDSSKVPGVRSVLWEVQRFRSAYLNTNANTTAPHSFIVGIAVPKPLARAAAQVAFHLSTAKEIESKFDVTIGSRFVRGLLVEKRVLAPTFRQLEEVMSARSRGRLNSPRLTQDEQLLLWEILAQRIYECLENKAQAKRYNCAGIVWSSRAKEYSKSWANYLARKPTAETVLRRFWLYAADRGSDLVTLSRLGNQVVGSLSYNPDSNLIAMIVVKCSSDDSWIRLFARYILCALCHTPAAKTISSQLSRLDIPVYGTGFFGVLARHFIDSDSTPRRAVRRAFSKYYDQLTAPANLYGSIQLIPCYRTALHQYAIPFKDYVRMYSGKWFFK